MTNDIIFQQILILVILTVVGIAGAKSGIITENAMDVLSKLIFNITLPLMLVCNFSNLNITPALLNNSVAVIILTFLTLLLMLLISWLIVRLAKMPGAAAAIFKTHSVFGNLVYLGFPLIFVSTIASLFTLPFILFLIKLLN